MSAFTQIATKVSGGTGIIRFDRPAARNALTDTMLTEAAEQIRAWEVDRQICAMVLSGDDRAFCAGGDLKATAGSSSGPFEKYRQRHAGFVWHEFMRQLSRCTKPVIAAIEGYALGGGLEIALQCDFIVASTTAKLGLTEAHHGLFPILGGAWSLRDAVGPRLAKELLFTARQLDGEEALQLGLVNHCVAAGEALDKALGIAGRIATNAPLAVTAAKQAVNRAGNQTFDEALATGIDLSAMLMFSEDRKEGLAAFKEKRPPRYQGK